MCIRDSPYDGYFAALFKENYYLHPEYQRAGGDWLNWQVPGTEYHIPIFQSGFAVTVGLIRPLFVLFCFP